MRLTISLLRSIAEALQEEALQHEEESNAWAIHQDAADALNDLADHVAETGRG